MVRVATATGPFHARVIVARLGAAGILGQARGIDGPYPNPGCVDVLVPEDEAEDAAALLAADARVAALGIEADAALGMAVDPAVGHAGTPLVGAALFLLLCVALVAVLAEITARL